MRKRISIPGVVLFLCCLPFIVQATHLTSHSTSGTVIDCVDCKAANGCRACSGGGDALRCYTPDCGSCILEGVCPPDGEGGGGHGTILEMRHTSQTQTLPRIDPDTIREIAQKQPRFAATIANMNMFGLLKTGVFQVKWTPVELLPQDIEAFINRGASGSFFTKFNQKARKLNKKIESGELSEIIYSVTIEPSKSAESNERVIKLQVLQGAAIDPTFSLLEIRSIYAKSLAVEGVHKEKPLKTKWDIQ